MDSKISDTNSKVVVEYKNKQPLDLLELTSSLTAVGEQYRRYASRELRKSVQARLFVGQLRSGSIIAELIPIMQAADWVYTHTDLAGGFVANYGDILNMIRGFGPSSRLLEKADVRGAKSFVTPAARDPGAEINIYAQEGATVTTNVFNFGTFGAQEIRRNADMILGGLPAEYDFDAAPMVLYQMRDGPAGTAGDYGIIDRFGLAPVKIRWSSDEVKSSVLERDENVFHLVYFVTGTAITAGGRVAAFNIRRLDDVGVRPTEDR